MTLIERTLIECRKRGWYAPKEGVTEIMTNRGKRRDFLGVVDLIVFPITLIGENSEEFNHGTLALQVTSASNHAARRKKSLANVHLPYWLNGGNQFEVWSWRQKGRLWVLRREVFWVALGNRLVSCAFPPPTLPSPQPDEDASAEE